MTYCNICECWPLSPWIRSQLKICISVVINSEDFVVDFVNKTHYQSWGLYPKEYENEDEGVSYARNSTCELTIGD